MPTPAKMKKKSPSVSPVGRKLVQARLPFKSVTPSAKATLAPLPAAALTPTETTRKRKLSAALLDSSRPAKVNKIDDSKENVLTSNEVIDLDDDLSKESVICILSEPDEPKSPKTPKATSKQVETPSNGPTIKSPKSKKTPTPKRTPKSSSKRKANSPIVVLDNDVSEANSSKPASFAIKIPIPKKTSASEKTPTRAKRGKNDSDTSNNAKDDIPADSHTKSKSPSPKKSTNPKKSPAKMTNKTTPVAAKKTQSSKSPNESPESKKPFSMNRRSRSMNLVKEKSFNESSTDDTPQVSSSSNANVSCNVIDTIEKQPSETPIEEDGVSNDCVIIVGESLNESTVNTSTPSKQQIPLVPSVSASKLTPKQLHRKLEAENRLKEKLRLKEERERKAAEDLEKRKKDREEKEEQRRQEKEEKEEQRRQEKEEKEREREEKKRKDREEREKKRLEEIEAKNEDRKRKEEQREEERKRKEEQKEEERKKKEEEKTAKEEADKQKNRKEAAAFTKFFVKNSTKASVPAVVVDKKEVEVRKNFMPFCVKEDMKLAPLVRRVFSDNNRCAFDTKVLSHSTSKKEDLYVDQLRKGLSKRGQSGKTWVVDETDVQIVDDELEGAASIIDEPKHKQKFRAKLFKFHENRRPAYYGTWRKRSSAITPRRPFVTDAKFFDYEVDSDDEWEEEEPGESLHGSDDEKDKESDDEYDIDNEFFVPHGHLSDEEVMGDDEEADNEDNTPETQKAKLKIVQMEFADEMKKKTQKIKPRLIGLIWQQPNGLLPPSCANVIADMLRSRAMMFEGPAIKLLKETVVETVGDGEGNDDVKASASKRQVMSDNEVCDLIRLIHGNVFGRASLVREFQHFLRKKDMKFSNSAISCRIGELALYKPCPDEGELMGKLCWYVSPECRQQYGLSELSTPNTWSYILVDLKARKAEAKTDKKVKPDVAPTLPTDEPKQNKPKFNISNFTKVLSDEEKQKQFKKAETPTPTKIQPAQTISVSATKAGQVVKKRVNLLMSVPRGQPIPTSTNNALISNFLTNSAAQSITASTTEVHQISDIVEIE